VSLVLASSSPRRRHLLAELGVPFLVVPSAVDERDPFDGEPARHYVLTLARQKAAEVAARLPDDTILAADTTVSVQGTILVKPVDADDAMRMLRLLRGREHTVTTGVVVECAGHRYEGSVSAQVVMRDFSDDEARAYVATGEPMDKAGGYAVQEFGGSFVEQVIGCYNAVVGLPLCLTADLLAKCGTRTTGPGKACRHTPE
jgi:septum formation protein